MEIIFFDIDYTLIRPHSKLAIISKENPKEIIMRIDMTDIPLMTTYWKKYNLKIDYNGQIYWLSPELYKNIKRKNSNITLSQIGISSREWFDKDLIDHQSKSLEFILNNFNDLKDSNIPVALLTARINMNANHDFIKTIHKELKDKLRLTVIKDYFIDGIDDNQISDITASRKAKIILEHLIGYKIKGTKFVDLKQESYDTIRFYDDSKKNIRMVNNLQTLFELCLKNTENSLKNEILSRVKDKNLIYTTYRVITNDLQPFIIKRNMLTPPLF